MSEYTRAGKESSSIYFPLERPEKFKLLGQEIKIYEKCADEALKAHFSVIYREGQIYLLVLVILIMRLLKLRR